MKFLWLVCQAWWSLVLFDLLSLGGFKRVHAVVRRWPTAARQPSDTIVADACRAVEEACVWYLKRVHCLQRSTVATWLLRWRGVRAQLVIGYRPKPVDSHAWVEVDGKVVNDRPQYQKHFLVLDRL